MPWEFKCYMKEPDKENLGSRAHVSLIVVPFNSLDMIRMLSNEQLLKTVVICDLNYNKHYLGLLDSRHFCKLI